MSVAFPGSDALTTPTASAVPGFDVLFQSSPTASSTASSSPTTISTLSPTDTYEPSATSTTAPTTILNEGTPVDLNQPGTVLADGSVVPGDPTSLASDQVQSAGSTDPFWATDAPSSDFDTPVPGFSTLFPTGVETNAAVNIENAANAAPSGYAALDQQVQAASNSELLADLGTGSSLTAATGTNPDEALLTAVSAGYNSGAFSTGASIDTSA